MSDATPSAQPPKVRFGTRPVESGRPASPTYMGTWRRTRRPGRPPERLELDRPTRFRRWCATSPVPHLHPRRARCSDPTRLRPSTGRRDSGPGEGTARHDGAQSSGDGSRDPARTAAVPGDTVRADRGVLRRWGRYAEAIARWERITGRPIRPSSRHPEPGCRSARRARVRGMAHGTRPGGSPIRVWG
jgi:DNA (cytosine-5)-methyltransferase 1